MSSGSLAVKGMRAAICFPLADLGNGKYSFVMPDGKVSVEAEFVKTAATSFADVPANAYFADAVKWAVDKGVTNGLSDTMFGPYASCTRAQIVTFLWRAAGSPEPKTASSFTDVPVSTYYAKAVAWAVENGITNGMTETTFAPNAACTHGQSGDVPAPCARQEGREQRELHGCEVRHSTLMRLTGRLRIT